MRKRLKEFEREFDQKVQKACLERGVEHLGTSNSKPLPAQNRDIINHVSAQIMDLNTRSLRKQNNDYYKHKANTYLNQKDEISQKLALKICEEKEWQTKDLSPCFPEHLIKTKPSSNY
jgi:hypothetical protein